MKLRELKVLSYSLMNANFSYLTATSSRSSQQTNGYASEPSSGVIFCVIINKGSVDSYCKKRTPELLPFLPLKALSPNHKLFAK